ncbi:MAG: TRAP transporter substrate-binding protein [Thermodesulfobacteriota bacterium]
MEKKGLVVLVVFFLLVLAMAPMGFAQEKVYTVRIGNVTPPDNPLNIAFDKMAAEMNEKSKGQIQAKVYPNSQLGNLRSMTEAVQMGTLEMATQSAGGLASFYGPMGVMELPFAYKSHKHVYTVVDGTIGQELGEQFRKKTGIRIVGYFMNLFRHLTNNVRPVRVPADLKGLKIRVPETPTIKMAIEAAGGNPVPMVWGEVYTALQQKTIDGQENPLAIIWASKIYEVQKYLSLTGHAYSPTLIMINDRLFQSMPTDLQKIVMDAARNASAWNRDFAEKQETELLGKLKEKGMLVNEVGQEAFRKLMVTVWDDFIKKNPNAKKYLDLILKMN